MLECLAKENLWRWNRSMKRASILDKASRTHYRTLPSCHSILRAIPELQKLEPDARLLIIGRTQRCKLWRSMGRRGMERSISQEGRREIQSWRGYFYRQGSIGSIPADSRTLASSRLSNLIPSFLAGGFWKRWAANALLSIQQQHQFKTWSIMGKLFACWLLNPKELAAAISELLRDREKEKKLGKAAHQSILSRFELNRRLQQQLSRINLVATGNLSN